MDRTRPDHGWRASALAVALFAITLNFLQPLAHAALVREGAPQTLWAMFCNSTAADPESEKGTPPVKADSHDCCLGLAHAPLFAAPAAAFVVLPPLAAVAFVPVAIDVPAAVGIRDGPTQPRGPPLPV
jgi:hypothetical protein